MIEVEESEEGIQGAHNSSHGNLVLKAVGTPVRLLLVWGDSRVGEAKIGDEGGSDQRVLRS